ncbi:nucleocapsid [Cumuto virus]|uniref:Nucleoprotein n=1 Tax=Cumuto virus TaxID=1457166 RepID=W5VFZ7_9VIRU|nr:nucleocapsid [Cumuto virus]AHH60919.1 nucleocapsid [Cumuto virus]
MSIVPTVDDQLVAEGIISDLADDVINDSTLAVKSINLAYQGFDPVYLMQVLAYRARDAKISAVNHKSNLRTLALIGTMRGSKIETISGRSGQELKDFLVKMVRDYKLKSGRPTSNQDATLLRIAAIYAAPLAIAIKNNAVSITTTIAPNNVAPGYPRFMCLSTFGALIPSAESMREGEQALIAGAFAEHQALFDRVINSRTKNYSPKDVIKNYIQIQQLSALYSEGDRIKTLLALGLIEMMGNQMYQVTALYRSALNAAKQKWDARV